MNLLAAAFDWTDPASIGYPALGAGVLLGSVVPVVPTGAVVGAAAAIATTTGRLWLPEVIALATAAALAGDLVTFAVGRAGSGLALRLVTRGQTPERLAAMRQEARQPRTDEHVGDERQRHDDERGPDVAPADGRLLAHVKPSTVDTSSQGPAPTFMGCATTVSSLS